MHAYLDGELDLVRNLEIENHLKDCPTCALRTSNHRAVQNVLRNSSLYFKAPAALETRLRSSLLRTRPSPKSIWQSSWTWLAAAASIAFVFVLGWQAARMGSEGQAKDIIVREIVSNHVRSLMATHLTDVTSSDQHTVKPWFKGQLDFSPPVKDLTKEGFSLVGGRLDYVGDHPAAALVYQRRKHFINLFIWPSSPSSDAASATQSQNGYHLIHWTEGGLTFWAVSDLNESELNEFVQLVRN
jgi:anti-sigma factor RsiW